MSTETRGRRAWLPALCAAALLLCGTAAAEDRLQQLRETGVLEVAVYRDFPPYSYPGSDGSYTGVDVDLAAALAQRLGLRLKLRPFLADENMDDDLRNQVWKGHYLGGGVADLMLHVGLDPAYAERQDKVSLFNAYQHETLAVIYRPRRGPPIDSPLALADRRIGVEVDTIGDYYLSGAFNGRLRTAAVRKLSVSEAIAAYLKGEVDAVMAPRSQLQGALHRAGIKAEEFEINEFAGSFRTSWDVGMAVKAGNPELEQALRAALDELRSEGRLQALFAAHGVEQALPSSPAALAARR